MNKLTMAAGLAMLVVIATTTAPAVAREGEPYVTIAEPGYYQPTYVQRGYRSEPEWERERDERRRRAMEWREHHSEDHYGDRGHDREEMHHDGRNGEHGDRGNQRNHEDHQH